jgi:hypothetical protein
MPNLLALSALAAVLLCIATYLRSRKKAAIALGVSMVLAAEGHFLVLGLSPDQLAELPFFVALLATEDGVLFSTALGVCLAACAIGLIKPVGI